MNTPRLTSRPRARALVRVQAASGLLFSAFATLHLLNTALGSLGPGAYNGLQRALRPVYQHPLVEIALILAPLLVHIAAGIVRMRGRPRSRPSLKQRAHRYAGYFLLASVFGHIGATRLPSLLLGVWPEFAGVASTFQASPWLFYPYYTALAMAGVVHLVLGVPLAVGMLGVRVPASIRRGPVLWATLGAIAAAVLLGVAGLGGLLYPVADQSAHPFAVVVQQTWAVLTGGGT